MNIVGNIRDLRTEVLGVNGVDSIPEGQRTVILDSRAADEILLAAAASSIRCSLRTAADLFASGYLIRQKKKEALHFQPSNPIDVKPGESVIVTFWIFNEFYAFRSVVTGCEAAIFFLDSPDVVQRIHRRRLDRTHLKGTERFPVGLREMNGRRHLSGLVTDLSPVGFKVEIALGGQCTADRLRDLNQDLVLVADIPGNPASNSTPAKIAHWEVHPDSSVARLGVACAVPLAVGDESALEDFLLERRYPDVVRARTDGDYEKIWEMLFGLERVVHVDASRKESSIITWKKTSWSSQPLHRIYLLRNPDDPSKTQGTLSVSRFYSRTWLIHQLAVDGTRGRVLSHQLYGRMVDFLRQTQDVKFIVGTWPKSARVFQRYYLDFIREYPDPSHNFLESCLLLEFSVAEALKELETVSSERPITIRPFDYAQQGEVLGFLRSKYPPMFLEALDLEEYRMLLEDVQSDYARVALQRKREIVLACSTDGSLAGFSIVEYGSPNQNIFGLFDNFRIFVLPSENALEEATRRQLLKATMRIYLQAGISNAVTWTTDEAIEKCVASCRRELPEAYFWIGNHHIGKPFLRHLDRLHGRMSTLRAARDERSAEAQ